MTGKHQSGEPEPYEQKRMKFTIGALSFDEDDEHVVIVNSDQPNRIAMQAYRAVKVLIPIPLLTWLRERVRRHPSASGAVAGAMAVTAVVAVVSMTVLRSDEEEPVRAPLAARTVTVTMPASPPVTITAKPQPAPIVTITQSLRVAQPRRGTPKATPRPSVKSTAQVRPAPPAARPVATTAPSSPQPSGPTPASSPTRSTVPSSGPTTPPPAEPPPESQPSGPPTQAAVTRCGGILHIGATIDPLLGVDLCVG